MFYISIVMGAPVGSLTDYWLGRFEVTDNRRVILAVIVAVLVTVLTYTGNLAHF